MIIVTWKNIKKWYALQSERWLYAFAKDKWVSGIVILFLIIMFFLRFLEKNWEIIQSIFEDATMVGILGTLLGALIGGLFTLIGAFGVGKYQIKAQTQVKRKNVIYKPLYDEIYNIHYKILVDNPYPLFITFESKPQTMLKYPQYVAWGRIKADTRYLETPSKLITRLNQLEADVKSYQTALHIAHQEIMQVLNSILEREVGVTCSISGIENTLLKAVLCDKTFDLFDTIIEYKPNIELENETKKVVQEIFVNECKKNFDIMELWRKRQAWYKTEEECIELLSAMIKRINAQYEE